MQVLVPQMSDYLKARSIVRRKTFGPDTRRRISPIIDGEHWPNEITDVKTVSATHLSCITLFGRIDIHAT